MAVSRTSDARDAKPQGDLNPTLKSTKAAPPVRKKGFAEMVPSGMPGPKDLERAKVSCLRVVWALCGGMLRAYDARSFFWPGEGASGGRREPDPAEELRRLQPVGSVRQEGPGQGARRL
jgi:hypothetical protein